MNTFDDHNEPGSFEEPPRRPPRDPARRPRSTPRKGGPPAGSQSVLRLAGLVALGIAIVVGIVLWVGACGSSTQDYSSYLDSMQQLAKESASVGPKFATALATPGLTMDSFQSDLNDWKQLELQDYVKVQRLQPPASLQSAHAEAVAAFQLRYNALDQIAKHLAAAQAEHASAAVAAAVLAGDAKLLSTSDVVWAELFKAAATQALKGNNVIGMKVPASRIVTNSDIVSASSLGTVYQRLGTPSSGHTVTGSHGSTLIATNAVENGISTPLSTTTGTTVAIGSNLVVDVVFKNSGAFPEVGVKVTMAITIGGESVSTHAKKVSQIAAGAQATVSFANLQVPVSAYSHPNAAIYVKIQAVPGEKQLGDNAASYPVLLRVAPS
jgi:hypothetical protein